MLINANICARVSDSFHLEVGGVAQWLGCPSWPEDFPWHALHPIYGWQVTTLLVSQLGQLSLPSLRAR